MTRRLRAAVPLALALASWLGGLASGRAASLPWPLVLTQEPVAPPARAAAPDGWAFSPLPQADGARLVRLDPDGRRTVLTPGFVWAGQPAVSADGAQILFSGRRAAGEPRSLWQVPAAGGAALQVTDGARDGDCGEPEYMAENAIDPPDFLDRVRWIVYTSDLGGGLDARLGLRARHLFARTLVKPAAAAGPVTWQTTYDPASALHPTMLADGRVLYSSFSGAGPEPGRGAPAAERYFLMAMTWEGVGMNEVSGAHDGLPLQTMAAELPDRTVVFVESAGERADGSGALAEIAWRRPLTSHRRLSHDAGRYRDPHPLPDGRLLVARAAGAGPFVLGLFERRTGSFSPLHDADPAWHEVDGQALAPHGEPMARIPAIWPDRFTTGDLHCMDVQESDRPELATLPPGTVRTVRILQAQPAPFPAAAQAPLPPFAPDAPFGASATLRTRVLGEVPVMPDGSFHVTLPADTAFTFQTLDAEGAVVRTMRSWIWTKPWFMRSCVGCHADRELAPPDRTTMALRSVLLPVLTRAGARPAPDWVHDLRPLVRSRCTGACHGPRVPEGRLVLDGWPVGPYDRGYVGLVPRHVVPGSARQSPLFQLLRGADGRPPHAALLAEELRTFAAWIDLGAQWDAEQFTVPVPGAGEQRAAGPAAGAGPRPRAAASPAAVADPAAAGERARPAAAGGAAPAPTP